MPQRPPAPMLCRWRRAALLLLLAAMYGSLGAARAGTLTVALRRVPCLGADAIGHEIERRSVAFMSGYPDASLVVSGENNGQSLRVRLLKPPATYEKLMPVSRQDCDLLASSLTLLVRSWVEVRVLAAAPVGLELPPTVPAPLALGDPSPPPEAPAPVASLVPAAGGLTLSALGGFVEAPVAGAARPALEVGLEHSRGPWGLGLTARYEAPVSTSALPPGRLSADTWAFGGKLRHAIALGAERYLDLTSGPAFELIAVRPTGYPVVRPTVVPRFSWVAALRLRQRLWSQGWLLVGVEADVRAIPLTVEIDRNIDALPLGRTRFLALAGIAWDAFR